jgi:uncharacterized protein YkwD
MDHRRLLPRALCALPIAAVLLPASNAAAADASAVSAAVNACPAAALQPHQGNLRAVERTTLCLLNRERRRHGLKRLKASRRLSRSAGRYAAHMARHDFFSHVSPGGSTMTKRIRRSGYLRGARGWSIGENLAWGSGRLATPVEAVEGWMNSPGHRANILSPRFRRIGIGIAAGAPVRMAGISGAATYTTHFGARL